MTVKNGVGILEHTQSTKRQRKSLKNAVRWNRLGSHKRKFQNLRVSEVGLENRFLQWMKREFPQFV